MTGEIQRLVDERWGEYGIGDGPAEANGRERSALRQLLRR